MRCLRYQPPGRRAKWSYRISLRARPFQVEIPEIGERGKENHEKEEDYSNYFKNLFSCNCHILFFFVTTKSEAQRMKHPNKLFYLFSSRILLL